MLAAARGHGLFVMGGLYLVLLMGEFSTFYGQFYLMMMVAQYSLSDMRLALFRHVERLPMAFFDRTPVGRLVSRMTADVDAINEMFNAGSLTIFIDLLTLCGIIAIMFTMSPRLGALGAVRDSAAGDRDQLFPGAGAPRVSRNPRAAGRAQRLPVGSDRRDGGDPVVHPRDRDPPRVRRAQHQEPRRADDGQHLRGRDLLLGRGAQLGDDRGNRMGRRRPDDAPADRARHAGRLYRVRQDVLHAAARHLGQVHRDAIRAGLRRAARSPDGRVVRPSRVRRSPSVSPNGAARSSSTTSTSRIGRASPC